MLATAGTTSAIFAVGVLIAALVASAWGFLRPLRWCRIRAAEGAQLGHRNWFGHAALRSFTFVHANTTMLGSSLRPASHTLPRCQRVQPGSLDRGPCEGCCARTWWGTLQTSEVAPIIRPPV